jgi:hypothetical protein
MNNVYFSNEGMTSTTANFYANIAKELQNAATERLNNVKFFKTSVAVIGSADKQLMSTGNTDLDFIFPDLDLVSSYNAFCAWVREAIKEKDNQISEVNRTSIDEWAKANGIELPESPRVPKDPCVFTEQDVLNTWDINKRNKYLRLEAFAATFGKYIHPEGAFSTARKKAHTALNKPITKDGIGRDMVLYYTESTVDIEQVDDLFMALQDKYRSYEKELNQLKAELKEVANKVTCDNNARYQVQLDEYRASHREYTAQCSDLRAQFNTWRTTEVERISKLKIAIPDVLKPVFKTIKAIGDTSK